MKRFGRGGTIFTSVVAGAAVLAVLGTSTAVAAGLVTSKQIKNGTIKSIDVKNESLKGVDILDGSLTGADVANGSLTGADVKDFSLSNQDVGVLFATVNADGSVQNSSGGVTALNFSTGDYEVDFGRDISQCAFVATPADPGTGSADAKQINVADRSGNPQAAFVNLEDSSGTDVDESFHLVAVC